MAGSRRRSARLILYPLLFHPRTDQPVSATEDAKECSMPAFLSAGERFLVLTALALPSPTSLAARSIACYPELKPVRFAE